MSVREAAVHFEAVKVKLMQSREGMLLTLAIHPDEVPDEIVRSFVGSRWMCAFVRIGDDDQPVKSPAQIDGERAVQSAAMLCRDPSFQAWMAAEGLASSATEIGAAEGLRDYLGIDSRADLKTDAAARELFAKLKERFGARR